MPLGVEEPLRRINMNASIALYEYLECTETGKGLFTKQNVSGSVLVRP